MAFVNDRNNTSSFTPDLINTQVFNFTQDKPLDYLAVDGIPDNQYLYMGTQNDFGFIFNNDKEDLELYSGEAKVLSFNKAGATVFTSETSSKETAFSVETTAGDRLLGVDGDGTLRLKSVVSLRDLQGEGTAIAISKNEGIRVWHTS